MPLYKTITPDQSTKVLIWKIEETFEGLAREIELTTHCQNRVNSMKSDLHRRGFMSIRHLLAEVGLCDADIEYSPHGKPHLKSDTHYISITHSHHFSAIIVSDKPVGVDVEKQRNKILRIAHKFTTLSEYHNVANEEALVRKLSVVWGAKESLYKLHGIRGLLFLNHIHVDDFDLDSGKTKAQVYIKGKRHDHNLNFLEFEGFTGVFTA
jgi:phosphopantetheinyl transferase